MKSFQKVLIINTTTKVGGAERSLIDVLSVFPSSIVPIIILPDKGELYQLLQAKADIRVIDLLRLKKGGNLFSWFKTILIILKGIYKMSLLIRAEKIDCIYSNTISAQIYAVLLKFTTQKKIIWHVRDNLPNKFLSVCLSCFADKILCVSQHIVEQVFFKKKAELVYNGIDTKIWEPGSRFSNNIKNKLGLDKNTILIAHIGQLIPWKRHDLFIDVARHSINYHNNVHFVIIGSDLFNDFPAYKINLKKKIEQSNLTSYFSLIGYSTCVKNYLEGIDILLHLADHEPFGRVLIEAMALGKPVIAINSGGPAEIVRHNESGYLISKAKPEVIAHKLNILISNPDLRAMFGITGRKIVDQQFSIFNLEKIASVIKGIYEENSYQRIIVK